MMPMVAIDVLKFATSSPADPSPLQCLEEAGYDASQILAVIGKTEGESSLTVALRDKADHV
jgi:cyanuric acid amidohydrolase